MKPEIHVIEHHCCSYKGSISHIFDMVALMSNPNRTIIIANDEIGVDEFTELLPKKLFARGKDNNSTIGRLTLVSSDGLEDALMKYEMGLYPGMEMIIFVNGRSLSGALRYLFNTSPEHANATKIIVTLQCGFKKPLMDILKREHLIGSLLVFGEVTTFVHETNIPPYNLSTHEQILFKKPSIGYDIYISSPI